MQFHEHTGISITQKLNLNLTTTFSRKEQLLSWVSLLLLPDCTCIIPPSPFSICLTFFSLFPEWDEELSWRVKGREEGGSGEVDYSRDEQDPV